MSAIYYIALGVGVISFIGLIVYARFFMKKRAPQSGLPGEDTPFEEVTPARSEKNERSSLRERLGALTPKIFLGGRDDDLLALPTESLIDVADVHYLGEADWQRSFLRTTAGDLVSILQIDPLLKTSESDASAYNHSFGEAIAALREDMSLQFVTMPIPMQLSGLTDRYALSSYKWRETGNGLKAAGNQQAAEEAEKRRSAAMQIGAMILQESQLANQRVALLVLTQRGSLWDADQRIEPHVLSDFQSHIEQVQTIFQNNNFPTIQLPVEQTLEILWHAYNPEISTNQHFFRSVERFSKIYNEGASQVDVSSSLSMDQILHALEEPKERIPQLLAPPTLDEGEACIRFNNQTMLLYYVIDYQSALPTVERLAGHRGQFANRLYISYYINIPSPAHIAHQSRKASTAMQAKSEINRRMGALESYKQREEIVAVEQTRYGAETEKNVLRTLGLYVGVMVDNDNIREETSRFEAAMTSAGLRFVPAKWNPLQVWQTMHPLGQRHHVFEVEDRNVFSKDLASLNPLPTVPPFDPDGEFLGFTQTSPDSTMPVSIVRKRGENEAPSDAFIGKPGSGKSYTLKQLMFDWLVRGHRVIAFDPNAELTDIVKDLGGVAIDILGPRGFNLLHFEPMDLEPGELLTKAMADMVFKHNVASIAALYASEKGNSAYVNATEKRLFSRALAAVMKRNDMHPRQPHTWKANKVFLRDVYDMLVLEMRHEDPETIKMIQDALAEYCVPEELSYERFNTPTELDLSKSFVVLHFGLEDYKPETTEAAMAYQFAMRIAMQHAVQSYLLDASPDPAPFHIVIDEASQLLMSPSLVQSVVKILSSLQKSGIYAHLAFQDMDALLEADKMVEDAKGLRASNNTLKATIPTYWLFKQQYASALKACEVLNLPTHEAEYIQAQRTGECLLALSGSSQGRIPLQIKAPVDFSAMLETDAASQKRRRQELYATKA